MNVPNQITYSYDTYFDRIHTPRGENEEYNPFHSALECENNRDG